MSYNVPVERLSSRSPTAEAVARRRLRILTVRAGQWDHQRSGSSCHLHLFFLPEEEEVGDRWCALLMPFQWKRTLSAFEEEAEEEEELATWNQKTSREVWRWCKRKSVRKSVFSQWRLKWQWKGEKTGGSRLTVLEKRHVRFTALSHTSQVKWQNRTVNFELDCLAMTVVSLIQIKQMHLLFWCLLSKKFKREGMESTRGGYV